jgi:hypothetical protein
MTFRSSDHRTIPSARDLPRLLGHPFAVGMVLAWSGLLSGPFLLLSWIDSWAAAIDAEPVADLARAGLAILVPAIAGIVARVGGQRTRGQRKDGEIAGLECRRAKRLRISAPLRQGPRALASRQIGSEQAGGA